MCKAPEKGLFYFGVEIILGPFLLITGFLPKKTPQSSAGICCLTWIRTKTNRVRVCRTTVILSGS